MDFEGARCHGLEDRERRHMHPPCPGSILRTPSSAFLLGHRMTVSTIGNGDLMAMHACAARWLRQMSFMIDESSVERPWNNKELFKGYPMVYYYNYACTLELLDFWMCCISTFTDAKVDIPPLFSNANGSC